MTSDNLDNIIPPPDACTIWVSGGNIYLMFPDENGRLRGIMFPWNEAGGRAVTDLLKDRERHHRPHRPAPVWPTQQEAWKLYKEAEGKVLVKRAKKLVINKEKPTAALTLEDLGLA